MNGSESYNVYYVTSPGVTTTSGTQLLDVRAPSVHLGLTNNTTYYYIVTAVNSFGDSLASSETSTTLTVPAGNPLPPASLAVNYNVGTSPIRRPGRQSQACPTIFITRPIYPDHTAADHVIRYSPADSLFIRRYDRLTYCYIVTAMNSAGESADSMQVCGPGGGSIHVRLAERDFCRVAEDVRDVVS